MIDDARILPDGTELAADLCIIGGGVAGITLACALAGTAHRILVLESGGLTPDGATQALYAGESVGQPYEQLATARSRYFGGGSNCWGGLCRPFEDIDLAARPWVPHSGWPFGRDELAPHYERAHAILGLGPCDYDIGRWQERLGDGIRFMPVDGATAENRVAKISVRPKLGEAHRAALASSGNVTVLLNANVTELETNDTASAVERVRCAVLGGQRFAVKARMVVLCAGGIENPRLLLLSNRVQAAGLGNGHDLVGRFFTDHPRIKSSVVRLADQRRHRPLYDMTLLLSRRRLNAPHLPVSASVAPTAVVQRALELLNSRTYLVARYHGEATDAFRALTELRLLLANRRKYGISGPPPGPVLRAALPRIVAQAPRLAGALLDNVLNPNWVQRSFTLETVLEPVPNPDSRVTLTAQRDALGLNRTQVDWRLTAQDRDNFVRTHATILDTLVRNGVIQEPRPGENPADVADLWPGTIGWCWHHMGTTRMHDDPRRGVVDRNGKVHGVGNLYVAGSSVFPTMGSDHPTINIAALALRLSEHLAALLGSLPAALAA
ncbi:MAG TPA: GMC family oxidoreductase [Azospirillum sp.]|nr:GMC family oxidoreductase [Azospirillum sp.]